MKKKYIRMLFWNITIQTNITASEGRCGVWPQLIPNPNPNPQKASLLKFQPFSFSSLSSLFFKLSLCAENRKICIIFLTLYPRLQNQLFLPISLSKNPNKQAPKSSKQTELISLCLCPFIICLSEKKAGILTKNSRICVNR